MSVNNTNTVVVVLGMHRSGTSAVTRGLEVLGVDLGDNLMPAAQGNNEKGFFEDLDIHALNVKLLSALDSDWEQLGPIQAESLLSEEFVSYHEEAKNLLMAKLQCSKIFAFKDPQISILLPFWKYIFNLANVRANYLICFRNPLSVAASLQKRDSIYPAKAQLLSAKYFLAALIHTQNSSRLVVDYDSLMENPAPQLSRIAKAFNLAPPIKNSQSLIEFTQEFLSPALRHTIFSSQNLADATFALGVTRELHALLQSLAKAVPGSEWKNIPEKCAILMAELEKLQPIMVDIDQLSKDRVDIQSLNNDCDSLRTRLSMIQTECREAWLMHDQALKDKHLLSNELLNTMQQTNELREKLEKMLSSNSWRLLRPLRFLRRNYRNPKFLLHAAFSKTALLAWRSAPFTTRHKQHIKSLIFKYGQPLLGQTKAYMDWRRQSDPSPHEYPATTKIPLKLISEPIEAVKKLQGNAPLELPARLIAYYLPQFHPTPENNMWWGEGFTEWTNVEPAKPHYAGHYQPHIPGDLGYYNLEDIEAQRHQVELAKLYGISGFCFYFYWFAGTRLLENPIKQYLNNPDLDLSFCLCWANENWSRRWDGLDDQILIGQSHSSEDDLAFIAYLAQYLRDKRYIRIDGKPLVLVYRPSLLPDPKSTAKRWRDWCRENGIGEIFLACTQSFDIVAPEKYGFDAAIEFPPNKTLPTDVTAKIEPLQNDFWGTVYDWSIYLKRSANYKKPSYKLFRGVFPSWDNTARRKNRGISFVNSSPRGYQEWLFNAIMDSSTPQTTQDERLVFINAWNEWAEGAHLEPDQRYGYGFLEATRMASLRASLHLNNSSKKPVEKLAVVVHAYYPDVFQEILGYLKAISGVPLKLYISTAPGRSAALLKSLDSCPHEYVLEEMPNQGRDMLPFLKVLPKIIEDGFKTIIKVHTKKSTHRADGEIWRRDLYEKLLTDVAMQQAQSAFTEDPLLGILGPVGHIVPMNFYWGSNASTVEKLACRLGIRPADLQTMSFVAGSMFFARVDALLPLLNLAVDERDFEAESGQVDGTFAHALERTLSISAKAAGLSVRSTEEAVDSAAYPFAEAMT